MHAHNEADVGRTGRYVRWGIVAFLLLIAAGIVISLVASVLYPPAAGTEPRWFFGAFFFPFGFLFFLFFVFFALRWFFRPWGWGWGRGWGYPYWHDGSDATEILRRRYARGEITREQFEQMMRDLGSRAP